jgi:hypothetical protein
MSQTWWWLPGIPKLSSLRQDGHEFKALLGYTLRSCLNNNDESLKGITTQTKQIEAKQLNKKNICSYKKNI